MFAVTFFLPLYLGKKLVMYVIENITVLEPKESTNRKSRLKFYRAYDEKKAIGFGLMWAARIEKIITKIVNYGRKMFGLNSLVVTVFDHKEHADNQSETYLLTNKQDTKENFNHNEQPEAKKFTSGDFY